MSSVRFDFDFLLNSPKNKILSILCLISIEGNNKSLVDWELSINRVVLFQETFKFEVAIIDPNSICAADSNVAAKRWKSYFVNLDIESHVLGSQYTFSTFVEVIQPVQVYKVSLSHQKLVFKLFITVRLYFLGNSAKTR